MGGNASACANPRQGQFGSDEESGGAPDKSGYRRARAGKRGVSRGGGSHHRQLKEEQFSGIAKIQLISVSPQHALSMQVPTPEESCESAIVMSKIRLVLSHYALSPKLFSSIPTSGAPMKLFVER